MTKSELIAVLERLEEYYRNFYSGIDKERVVNAWYPMFRDDDPALVNRAAVVYICTEKFAPTVSGIKGIMAELRMEGQMTEMQAWGKIRDAVTGSTNRNEASREFTKLPPILRKIVANPSTLISWRNVSEDTFEGVIASNFQRSYREHAKREAVYYAIPGQLQAEQAWRVEGPGEDLALPEPEIEKTISQVVEEANEKAAEHGMTMTEELREKHSSRLDSFFTPITKDEKRIIQRREERKGERFLK